MQAKPAFATPGGLDTTFSTDGYDIIDVGGIQANDSATSVLTYGAYTWVAGTYFDGTRTGVAVAKYDFTGALDTTFGTGGVRRIPGTASTGNLGAPDIDRLSDGRLALAYITLSASVMNIRYLTANGADDGGVGVGLPQVGAVHVAIAALSDNDDSVITATGNSVGGQDQITLERWAGTTLMSSFSSDGIAQFDVNNSDDDPVDVAIDGQDRIVVLGDCVRNIGSNQIVDDTCLLRVNLDGTLDSAFNTTGVAMFTSNGGARPNKLIMQGDYPVASGSMTNQFTTFLARWTPTGAVDINFGTGGSGYATTSAIHGNTATALTDGSILVVDGASAMANISSVHFNEEGVYDTTYGVRGFQKPGSLDTIVDLGLRVDNTVMAVGATNSGDTDWYTARIEGPAPPGDTGSGGSLASDSASQTVTMNVLQHVEPGVIAISVDNEIVTFGDVTQGEFASADLGGINYKNTLNNGSPWSASVVLSQFHNGASSVPYNDLALLPGSNITPGGSGIVPGDPGVLATATGGDGSESDPRTMMTASSTDQGDYTQSGSTLSVLVPVDQTPGTYQGTLQYTVIG